MRSNGIRPNRELSARIPTVFHPIALNLRTPAPLGCNLEKEIAAGADCIGDVSVTLEGETTEAMLDRLCDVAPA